ncbi:hypothetical protein BESB_045240 [Besnoitia besnoiti]|uniref:PITH domain-containing protein n=1 Tax=Besnoitia besnoiti TaxID=94643 RepID=A0A2A9MLK5_BESBE|nr:hypothetical protein BESB_045240 [Besnoitia besnoiti]PFH36332.1 hypothetical protein BESB_045240 [Besnoitia besnoiti]
MANIDSTASNTNRMREHLFLKRMQSGKQQEQEEDLCVCHNVVNFKLSVCLNQLEPSKQAASRGAHDDAESGRRSCSPTEGLTPAGSNTERAEAQSEQLSADASVSSTVTADRTNQLSGECATSPAENPPEATNICQNITLATLQDILLANPTDKCLVSDVDEQLLINIFFNSPVRVTSVAIRSSAPPSSFEWKKESDTNEEDDELPEEGTVSEPKLIKIYSNKANLDFSTVSDETPAQIMTLTYDELKGEERMLLRGSKFQRCSSLHLFIEKNQANTVHTFVNRICLYGYVNKNYSS